VNNKKLISVIYWTHFAVAATSHVFVVLMIGGAFTLVVATPSLGFWLKGLLLGITFYSAMYAINHVTNKDGFCVLTDLENYYRKQENMSTVKEFTPRFYRQCRIICSTVYRFFRRKK
jgi:hypothetical protein